MPQSKIALKPGVNTTATATLADGTWSTSNLVRFLDGFLQKIGGWAKICNTAVTGVARGLHAFSDLNSNSYLAVGTNSHLYIMFSGVLYDITPIRRTDNVTNAFSTVSGSAIVTVVDTAHSAGAGDTIYLVVPLSIGGMILFGYYTIATIIDANTYTITSASNATSTVTNGGSTPNYAVTNTSNIVTVTFNNHGQTMSSIFTVHIATTVGGVTLSGDYIVASVISANQFTFGAINAATSTANAFENNDQEQINYLLTAGPASDIILTGWGAGGYGLGPYGIGLVTGLVQIIPARNWHLDNFGQVLIVSPTNGGIYTWTPPVSANNPAVIIPTAPLFNTGVFVAMPQAQIIAFGAEVLGIQDPLLVRFCDIGNFNVWTASTTNQAGSFRLSRGSRIIGGLQAPQAGLLWTDIDLWTVQYQGFPFVYGFLVAGTGCGLLAVKARAQLGRTVYWLSVKGFFQFGDNGVQPLPCAVWDRIFGNISTGNVDKCLLGANSLFNEVICFYPSLDGSGEIDSYVKFNVETGTWDYGSLERTAWIDENIFGAPIGVDGFGFIQQHEISVDADGTAMTNCSAMSGYADISDGTQFMFIDQLIPDFYLTGPNATVTVTIYGTNWPGDAPTIYGPYTVTSTTEYITLRVRLRQIAIKVESDTLGTFWRLGAIRYRGAPAGRV